MIRTENLTRIFRTEEIETIALNGVNINVEDGEFVAIMGPSGCGKSTLLNILGLLDTPTEGKYWLGDEEVGHLKERERTAYRKGRIGFVFQNFNLIDELTVEENIDLQLKYLGIGKAERKERVLEILRKVKLSIVPSIILISFRAVSSRGLPSPVPWWASLASSLPMSYG